MWGKLSLSLMASVTKRLLLAESAPANGHPGSIALFLSVFINKEKCTGYYYRPARAEFNLYLAVLRLCMVFLVFHIVLNATA